MIIALIIIAVVLSILAGFSKALCDLSEEGKLKFKNYFFWWKDYAWKNLPMRRVGCGDWLGVVSNTNGIHRLMRRRMADISGK